MSVSDELLFELGGWINARRREGRSDKAIREALLRAGLAIPDGAPAFFPADRRIVALAPQRCERPLSPREPGLDGVGSIA